MGLYFYVLIMLKIFNGVYMKFFKEKVERYDIPVKRFDPKFDSPAMISLLKELSSDESELTMMSLEEFIKLNEEKDGQSTSN